MNNVPALSVGEVYAGSDGVDHLILLAPGAEFSLWNRAFGFTWDAAVAEAARRGGDLPTADELQHIVRNCADQLEDALYWSSTERRQSIAVYHAVKNGKSDGQYDSQKCYARGRLVRIVRRVQI